MLSRLKELRESRRFSLSDVAERLHIAKSTYAGYEYGRRSVPNELLKEIAEIYNVTTDYILGLSDGVSDWRSVDDVAANAPDISEEMKKLGATVIKLNAELLERGMSREELESLLKMMINLQSKKS